MTPPIDPVEPPKCERVHVDPDSQHLLDIIERLRAESEENYRLYKKEQAWANEQARELETNTTRDEWKRLYHETAAALTLEKQRGEGLRGLLEAVCLQAEHSFLWDNEGGYSGCAGCDVVAGYGPDLEPEPTEDHAPECVVGKAREALRISQGDSE